MKKILFGMILGLLTALPMASAQQVTATGYGSTAAEAENDALRAAVENVVGTLLDAQTIVDKNTVLQDEIYTSSRGFIRHYDVLRTQQTAAGAWSVTVAADVDSEPDSKLMDALTRERLIAVNMRNAKIAVILDASNASGSGESAVVDSFLQAGFQNIVDISNARRLYNQPYYMDASQLQSLAQSLRADILLVGQAYSDCSGDVGQFIGGRHTGILSCQARIAAKMYIARTGQVLAAHSTEGAGADITEAVAAGKALTAAGNAMGEYMVQQLLDRYSGNRQQLELTVLANSLQEINTVKQALASLQGVKNVTFNNYNNGRGVISLQYSGAPQTLFALLQQNMDYNLQLEESTFNTLTIVVN